MGDSTKKRFVDEVKRLVGGCQGFGNLPIDEREKLADHFRDKIHTYSASVLSIPCGEILAHYGMEHQRIKAIEELQELEEALDPAAWDMDFSHSCPATSLTPILTECADVIIMMAQLLELEAVLWPATFEPRARKTMDLAHFMRVKVLSKPASPVDTRLHIAHELIVEAIRVALAISSKERLQEEIYFKIDRQLQRIQEENTDGDDHKTA